MEYPFYLYFGGRYHPKTTPMKLKLITIFLIAFFLLPGFLPCLHAEDWQARHNLSSAQYQQTFTDLKNLRQAEAIQIDHVVPLAEAWVSGARRWSRTRREAFANDLGELLAVDGPTNMSKGDGDPASWRPRRGYQCTYARRWIAVKTHYRLEIDGSEKAALNQMRGLCH